MTDDIDNLIAAARMRVRQHEEFKRAAPYHRMKLDDLYAEHAALADALADARAARNAERTKALHEARAAVQEVIVERDGYVIAYHPELAAIDRLIGAAREA